MWNRLHNFLVERAFDRWAEENYSESAIEKLRTRGHGYDKLSLRIIEHLNLRRGGILLDIGCGSGIVGTVIKAAIPDVTIIGIDLSKNMLKVAKKTNAYDHLLYGNAESLPFSDKSIDFISSSFMFHSLMKQEQALKEIKRVMKPSTKGIIIDLYHLYPKIPFLTKIITNIHSIYHEYGAPAAYKNPLEFKISIKNAGLLLTEHELVGIKKRYSHWMFVFRKEGSKSKVSDSLEKENKNLNRSYL